MTTRIPPTGLGVLLGLFVALTTYAEESATLDAQFREPPESAKPWTWWHWMNGCVTREGITTDLEAMKRVGLRGAFMFNVDQLPIDDPSVQVLNSKWNDLLRFAISEAARLGLQVGAHNCAGWSSSGGPWVQVQDSMQKIVWSELPVTGPAPFNAPLSITKVDGRWNYYEDVAILALPAGKTVNARDVIDLTDKLSPDGKLSWNVPDGQWTIFRFGHTTTGKENNPAPMSGRGLECDKMSREAVAKFWEGYPAQVLADAGTNAGTVFKRILIDSYEAGEQNWTPQMRQEFQRRRGYDPVPWLPVQAGRVISSPELTQRFKSDLQRTISELFIDNYYAAMQDLTHRHPGVEFAIEPYTGPFDTLSCGGRCDDVMSEFWQKPSPWGWDSVKPVSSSAHVWGKQVVGAEAFTGWPKSSWQQDPFALKTTGDKAFCLGVNQLVLHTTAHQPWTNAVPGMTMGWWGTQFGRTQTWWDHGAAEWIRYLTRCQYLLQQGTFVADLLYLEHSLAPLDIPPGYDADACPEDALLSLVKVDHGRLVLPDGMSYRVLVLPRHDAMTPQVAQKIRQLVADGATVVGSSPTRSPSLQDYPECDAEVRRVAADLWGAGDVRATEHTFGKGRVFHDISLQQVLAKLAVSPDLVSPESGDQANLMWIHRHTGNTEIYFVSNQREDKPVATSVSFRVKGLQPELWHADTGEIEDAAVWRPDGDRTVVPLRLDPGGSLFVVFRHPVSGADPVAEVEHSGKPDGDAAVLSIRDGRIQLTASDAGLYRLRTAAGKQRELKVPSIPGALAIEGGWEILFQPNRGAPDRISLDRLVSWTENKEPGVRYFSGTATYHKTVEVPSAMLSRNLVLILDLGKVRNTASVAVNGKEFGVLWKPPFRVDLTGFLKKGKNELEIKVTNLWANRLIGDEQEPADVEWGSDQKFRYDTTMERTGRALEKIPQWLLDGTPRPSHNRVTLVTFNIFTKDSPLQESGLLGPVRLEAQDLETVR